MKIHKRYFVESCAAGIANVVDIFTGSPVFSNGRPMVALPFKEASAIADVLNAVEEARLRGAHSSPS